MPTVLVTSASRGIGLEFARSYAADGWEVLAACRDPEAAGGLRRMSGRITGIAMDVTDLASVQAAAAASDAPVDLLINSAGVIGRGSEAPGQVDYHRWSEVLDVNTFGPVRVLDAFVPRLAASQFRRAVTITSGLGSIGDAGSGGSLMYRTSKAAVNMAMRARSFSLKAQGITVIVLNPGWVQTDMGGPGAALTAEQSITAMRRVIDALSLADSGKFFNHTGAEYPW